ncbi:MAG: hypothetical protein ACFB6R_17550 [Alphaproteobacteria bacterium]
MTEMAPEAQARLETYLADVAQALDRAGFDEGKIRAARDFLADQVFDRLVDLGGPADLETLEPILQDLDAPDVEALPPQPPLGTPPDPGDTVALAARTGFDRPVPETETAAGTRLRRRGTDLSDPKPLKRVRPRPGDRRRFFPWPFGRKAEDPDEMSEFVDDLPPLGDSERSSRPGGWDTEPAQAPMPGTARSDQPDPDRPRARKSDEEGLKLWPGADEPADAPDPRFRMTLTRADDNAASGSFLDGAGFKMLPGFGRGGGEAGRASLSSLFLGRRAQEPDREGDAPELRIGAEPGTGNARAPDTVRGAARRRDSGSDLWTDLHALPPISGRDAQRDTGRPDDASPLDQDTDGFGAARRDRSASDPYEGRAPTPGSAESWDGPAWGGLDEAGDEAIDRPRRRGSAKGPRAAAATASLVIGMLTPVAAALIGGVVTVLMGERGFTAFGLAYIAGMLASLALGILGMGHRSGQRGLGWSGVLAVLLLAIIAAVAIQRF